VVSTPLNCISKGISKSTQDSHTTRVLFKKLFQGPLFANCTIIIITHHVELVLPATVYLVCMLDSRINVKGTPKDLCVQGVLEEITHEENIYAAQQEVVVQTKTGKDPEAEVLKDDCATTKDKRKSPMKLVKDEHCEEGSAKWSIHNTYLKATYVLDPLHNHMTKMVSQLLLVLGGDLHVDCNPAGMDCHCIHSCCITQPLSQLATVGEKFWIQVSVYLTLCQQVPIS
jgi:hypothetical protein